MKPFPYSIWLVPCAEQRVELARMIGSLAARFGTIPFAPHATLCSGTWGQGLPALIETVDRMAAQFSSQRLNVEGMSWSDRWFGFFFLRLRCEMNLFARACGLVEGSHSPDIGPHVSLLYRFNAEGVDRNALREGLMGVIPSVIRFDALELVRPSTGRWEDVAGWESLHTVSLAARNQPDDHGMGRASNPRKHSL